MANTKQVAFLSLVALLLISVSCVPAKKEDLTDIEINLSDTTQQKILTQQDLLKSDSLVTWFHHEDATYRYLAARAFGSIKKHEQHEALYALLSDPVEDVRIQAVYALGQSGQDAAEDSLINRFDRNDTLRINDQFNAEILEAVGKIGSESSLKNIASVKTYRPTDTTLLEGQAWAIYRFGLRGILLPEGTSRMVEFVKGSIYPPTVQWIASNYLMRMKDLDLSEHSAVLNNAFRNKEEVNTKMCLALALSKCKTETSRRTLVEGLKIQQDYRVYCSILRALKSYNLNLHYEDVVEKLKHPQLPVAQCAADLIYSNGDTEQANEYKNLARDTMHHWSVRATLYQAAHANYPFYYSISKGAINWDLTKWKNVEKDPYVIGAIIRAQAEDPKNYNEILKALDHEHDYVSTTAASSLKKILDDDEFEYVFSGSLGLFQRKVNEKIEEKMRGGDPGLIAEMSSYVGHKNLKPSRGELDYTYLDTVLLSLSLPEHIETYNVLQQAIARIKGKNAPEPKTPLVNHPMDWKLIKSLSDSSTAEITTTKGTITMRFLTSLAPATVANFVDLSERGFYDGKNFHRVVPNFVIQGGCPRGDGYGSLNYTIRSELPKSTRFHQEGKVGMASAGNHTECTQWFVTHSPTPHLDGNYTIFADIIKGMDVVHRIEQGDIIQSVTINR